MLATTTRFGEIEVDPATIIHFPLGLLGFERFQRYVLIDSDEAAPMRWLQCVDEPTLAFLIVEPALFFADYDPQPSKDDREFLGLKPGETAIQACLVVIPDDPREMTINLMGPLMFNGETRVGKQVVLHDSGFSPRQRLIPDESTSEAAVTV